MCYVRYDNSGEILTLPFREEGEVRVSPCARSELLNILREGVQERGAARLWTGNCCVGVEDLNDHVLIHFSDTTTVTADLLIAADGIHSPIRHQFAPSHATFSGFIAYRGVVPMASLPSWPFPSYSVAWLAKHKHFLVYSISADKDLNIVAFVTKEASQVQQTWESWTSTCDREEVERDFEGFDGVVREVIALTPKEVSRWRINDHEPLNQWHYANGKVILLGDAAHAMTPHLGAGGGVAIADGWVLGRALSEYLSGSSKALNSLEDVTELYQASRLQSAHRTQAASRANGDSVEMQTPEMIDKSYDECVKIVGEGIKARLGLSLGDDTDVPYEKAREMMEGKTSQS